MIEEQQLRRLQRIQHDGDRRRAMMLDGEELDESYYRMKESEFKVDDHFRKLQKELSAIDHSKSSSY